MEQTTDRPEQEDSASGRRALLACEQCRKRKVKCSGERPCRHCARQGVECTSAEVGRKRYSESYVQRLRSRLHAAEARANDLRQPTTADHAQSEDFAEAHSTSRDSPSCDVAPTGATTAARETEPFGITPLVGSPYSHSQHAPGPLSPDPIDLASGPALDTHIQSLVYQHSPSNTRSEETTVNCHRGYAPQTSIANPAEATSPAALIDSTQPCPTPTQTESFRLLDLFLTHTGATQHYLDTRTFTDQISLLYQSRHAREKQQGTVWYVEYLLVMALGKLLDEDHGHVSKKGDESTPGMAYFAEAAKRLPPLYALRDGGVTAVEALALAATYLLWTDRNHDAYLYVGSALRLAIALGCAQPYAEQTCWPSEATHRVRLFWTLYMLDRRLASTLSLPVGVNNQQIKADMPRDFAGFPSAMALKINIKIAHTTGEIMCSLYGNQFISRTGHAEKIEEIMKVLREIGMSIEKELPPSPLTALSRDEPSLRLRLYQAILLCLRPILLREVRLKVSHSLDGVEPRAHGLAHLVRACRDAAAQSVRILASLLQTKMLPRFGSLDLDATFSAAFILVLIGLLDDTPYLPGDIRTACHVLQHMSNGGYYAAARRLKVIAEFCAHIWPIDETALQSSLGSSVDRLTSLFKETAEFDRSGDAETEANELSASREGQQPPRSTTELHQTRANGRATSEPQIQEDLHSLDLDNVMMSGLQYDFTGNVDGVYSSFYDPGLPLTGIDYADWLEMERLFEVRH